MIASDKYDFQWVLYLLDGGETSRVECKLAAKAIPDSFWESYSAFANTDGGIVLLGIKEENRRFSIEGVSDAKKIVADFWNTVNGSKVSANVVYDHNVHVIDCDGKTVIAIEIPRAERSDRPVHVGEDVFKGTYRRNGEGDYHCSREAVKAMIRDQCVETADVCLLDELAVGDLDADSVRRYRTLFDGLRPGHVWGTLPDDEFLVKIGGAKRLNGKIHPTLAGLVCFGEFSVISDVLPYFFLDYREHMSNDVRWTDRICSGDATWSGNVLDFFFKINQRITADVKTPFRIASDNVTRDDDTPVHKALREVLANALIHADYHGRQGIVVEKRYKRLSVSNPGALRISKSVAIAGGTSDARNAKIFNIFSLVKIGERSGIGLSNLFGVWEQSGYARPIITESFDPERTRVDVEIEVAEKSTEKRGEHTGKLTEKHGEYTEKLTERNVVLTETEEKIVSILESNGYSTQKVISTKLGITRTYVTKIMGELQTKGVIRRIGPDKGGHWEVVK